MASLLFDPGRACGLPDRKFEKNQYVYVCWAFPAPVVVLAIEEVTFRVLGYDDKVES